MFSQFETNEPAHWKDQQNGSTGGRCRIGASEPPDKSSVNTSQNFVVPSRSASKIASCSSSVNKCFLQKVCRLWCLLHWGFLNTFSYFFPNQVFLLVKLSLRTPSLQDLRTNNKNNLEGTTRDSQMTCTVSDFDHELLHASRTTRSKNWVALSEMKKKSFHSLYLPFQKSPYLQLYSLTTDQVRMIQRFSFSYINFSSHYPRESANCIKFRKEGLLYKYFKLFRSHS